MEKRNIRSVVSALAVAVGLLAGNVWAAETPLDVKMVERGQYVAKVSGCNACHTPGYLQTDGNVSVEHWLARSLVNNLRIQSAAIRERYE